MQSYWRMLRALVRALRGRRGRLAFLTVLGVLLAAGAGTALPDAHPESGASVMDTPLRLIAAARQSYEQVQDYSCLFVKREKINGAMQPENLMAMKVRKEPFSVYLRWVAPKELVGQEVCYVAGRNNGMMRAKSKGLLGVVGFVSLDPRDPRATATSRHVITEAGIGNLIERYGKGWELERRLNVTEVKMATYEYNKRKCNRVETRHRDNANGRLQFYRSVVYFDKEHHMPIRVENYDWPRPGGPADGELVESYSYADLRFNVGLGDEVFNH